jgi:ABC-type Fe3+-siderophore transport system permease subunit
VTDWPGRAAFALAVGVAIALVVIVLQATFNGRQLENGEVTAISTVVGASVGAVATYLGSQATRTLPPPDDDDDDDDDDDLKR